MTAVRANRRWTESDLAQVQSKVIGAGSRQMKLSRPRDDNRFEAFGFELPWPPSQNGLYHNKASGGRGKTEGARDYTQLVCGALMAQRVPTRYIGHPCDILILQHAPTERGDVDNGVKIVLDCLKRFGVLFDDNRKIVKSVLAADAPGEPGGRLEIRIAPRIGAGVQTCDLS